MKVEISIKRKDVLRFFSILLLFVISLSFFDSSSLSLMAKEENVVETKEEQTVAYSSYYPVATSDAKKIYFTTSQINLNFTSSVYIPAYIKADPTIDKTMADISQAKYYVGNPNIAEISYGSIIPKKSGKTWLYVDLNGMVSKTLLNISDRYDAFAINQSTYQDRVYVAVNDTFNIKDYIRLTVTGDATKILDNSTYRVGNAKISSIDKNGKVTAKSIGNTYAYITSSAGLENRIMVSVVSNKKPERVVMPEVDSISVGESRKVNYSVEPVNVPEESIKWSVGNNKIAKVNDIGVVTGLKKGNTYLYAKYGDQQVRTLLKVNGSDDPVGFKFDQQQVIIDGKKNSNYLQVSYINANGENISLDSSYVLNASVGNPNIAEVSPTNNSIFILGKNYGNTWLNLELNNGLKTRIMIRVVQEKIDDLSFKESSTIRYVGDSFTVEQELKDIKVGDTDRCGITYRVGNPNIAKLDSFGVLTCYNPGKTWLYADCQGRTDKILLEVKPAKNISKLSFKESSITINAKNNLTYVSEGLNISPEEVSNNKVTFVTGNPNVAIVNQDMTVIATGNGKTWLYATTSEGVQAKVLVEVVGFDELTQIDAPTNIVLDRNNKNSDQFNVYLNSGFASQMFNHWNNFTIEVGNQNVVQLNTDYWSINYPTNQKMRTVYLNARKEGKTYIYYKVNGVTVGKTLVTVGYDISQNNLNAYAQENKQQTEQEELVNKNNNFIYEEKTNTSESNENENYIDEKNISNNKNEEKKLEIEQNSLVTDLDVTE